VSFFFDPFFDPIFRKEKKKKNEQKKGRQKKNTKKQENIFANSSILNKKNTILRGTIGSQ
jgi:hypothetical protein